jgi:hypothetical protein
MICLMEKEFKKPQLVPFIVDNFLMGLNKEKANI